MPDANPLLNFLLDPQNYPERPSRVVHYETHISHVFVGDSIVYKIKKPVNFGFLDFTTLQKRHFFCEQEVRLNRRLAPRVYLGVQAIYGDSGNFSFDRSKGSAVIEYAVKMRKIPEEKVLFQMINHGQLLYREMDRVAETLTRFHRGLPKYTGTGHDGLKAVMFNTEEDFQQIRPFRGSTIEEEVFDELVAYTRDFIKNNKTIFDIRRKKGFVKECHGDLHSQHVCLTRPPVIFDCIEFNERFRIIDVIEDIAFLLMDLEFEGRFDLANAFYKKYFSLFSAARHDELLLFYKVYRATVRGKVEGFISESIPDAAEKHKAVKMARDYFSLAKFYMEEAGKPFNPVIFMGVSGSGKSTLAKGMGKNWTVIRSDEIRKDLAGMHKTEHSYVKYGKGIYTPEHTETTYNLMLDLAVSNAAKGKKVAIDATYLKASRRIALLDACRANGLNPFFVYCFADKEILRSRIEKRIQNERDTSDATLQVLNKQLREAEFPHELPSFRLMRLDTGNKPEIMIRAIKGFLQ